MNAIVALAVRQIPWEKVINFVVEASVDRIKRNKVKKLPNKILVSDTSRAALGEINRRIREKQGGIRK